MLYFNKIRSIESNNPLWLFDFFYGPVCKVVYLFLNNKVLNIFSRRLVLAFQAHDEKAVHVVNVGKRNVVTLGMAQDSDFFVLRQ